jgi:chitin disaccharide deacetylase
VSGVGYIVLRPGDFATDTILCADDYAMTVGVSDGIDELAAAGRLSATSAMVTSRHWVSFNGRVAALREKIAVGLHFNLTLGAPLGPMPSIAPDGRLPAIGSLIRRGLLGALPPAEITAEVTRQLDQFERITGCLPDFIDGHQHVHALPGIRHGFLLGLAGRGWKSPPLIRVPADNIVRILARGAASGKSLTLAGLGLGFGRAVQSAGFAVNKGFSGASGFDERVAFEEEFAKFLRFPGSRHLVMCHPGHVDAELATLDPVVGRRAQEFAALMALPDLPTLISHPKRSVSGAIDWATDV